MRASHLAAALLAALPTLTAQTPLKVSGLSPRDPLSLTATATASELAVEVRLKPEWHLYGRDTGGGQPVTFEVLEGSAFAAASEPDLPMDEKGQIVGKATLTLPLRRVADGGALEVAMRFMVCDPLMCLPPKEVRFSGTVGDAAQELSVLLVVKERGERSDRIAAFLKERGFSVAVVPYAEVAKDQCDAHDVVLADSPYFEDAGGVRDHVSEFPRTTSPIVAVGYLGTVLLEAHRIAMACGYI